MQNDKKNRMHKNKKIKDGGASNKRGCRKEKNSLGQE